MNMKHLDIIVILILTVLFIMFAWKWFAVILCLYLIFNVLYDEIKGIGK